jgi:uncharacterized membrane protein
MTSDLTVILVWWVLITGMGVSFWPLTAYLFPNFRDKGWVFGKIISLAGITYLAWILGSFRLVEFSPLSLWILVLLGFVFNIVLLRNNSKLEGLKNFLKHNWSLVLLEEMIFLAALIAWSWVRGFQPDIQGLEKFMDFGFVNSILRSRFFPPADMWFAGSSINYYYFGHLMTAVLIKLSGIRPEVAYNLAIAGIFAFATSMAFSLGGNLVFFVDHKPGANLKKYLTGGALTLLFLNLGANLHPLYYWITNHGFESYWYPDATRFIVEKFGAADNTIHEFPIYSYVVADLHGHLLDLPLVLLFLALCLSLFMHWQEQSKTRIFSVTIALLLAIMYMTSTWDYAIYLLFFGLLTLIFNYLNFGFSEKTVIKTFQKVVPILILSILFFLPFQLRFKNIAGGIALAQYHTPPWMFLVLWGWPLFLTLISAMVVIVNKEIRREMKSGVLFLVILLGTAWILIGLPEVIYVKDIYIQSYQRANTMFKFTYQSFVMFSLAASVVLLVILPKIKSKLLKFLLFSGSLFFMFFIFIYPYYAVKSYYGLTNYRSLDGLTYLQQTSAGDYEAVNWLNKLAGQPVIVEAVGESYTEFARISANTGLPTILGWRVHEWLWRGSFDEPGKRTEEVRQIYESTSLPDTINLLNKYQVKYVIIGALEKKQYPQINISKFSQLGNIVFSDKGTTIYEIN